MFVIDTSEWIFLGAGVALGLLVGAGLVLYQAQRSRAREEKLKLEIQHQAEIDAEREAAVKLASERLSAAFNQLANDQFRSHSETFLRLAREHLGGHQERAKGELEAREKAIENLVKPIREALSKTEERLRELDKSGRESHGSIKAQLETMAQSQRLLTAETRNLVSALRRPEVRGRWGELTLRRLVELAGMVEHCDFATQTHQATESGAIRPDMVIHLPESRRLVVDVKTPLDAYLEATEAETEALRAAALARHATIVKGRIRELAAKAYWAQFEDSPEFVILFIPGDQFLSAALSQEPNLLDEALRQNIILATPTSFVALLKAVAYGWQQVSLAENAAEIRALAVELYERLTAFSDHLATLGKALTDGVKAFNRSIGSLELRVLPSARRLTELGVKPKKKMRTLRPIGEIAREPTDASDERPEQASLEDDEPDQQTS
jgi:DNA recombination protein RmuC